MKNKRIITTTLMLLLVACFVLGMPTVAHAASGTGAPDVGGAISNFFGGILNSLVMIIQGIINLCAIIIQFFVDLVMLIVGLFI